MSGNLLMVGGTGGIGVALSPILKDRYVVSSLGSKDLDIRFDGDVEDYFKESERIDTLLFLSVLNVDSTIHKLDPVVATKQININCRGFVNVLRYIIPKMREQRYGRIIYVSSVLAERPIPGTGIYAASKAFNDTLIKTAALENAKYGITCNSIRLGYFEAGLTYKVPQEVLTNVMENIPLKRLGKIQELANTIDFIINTEYLTGTIISLSGGLSIS